MLSYALILAGIVGVAQPWIVAPAASMTLNATDLAEWASLIPTQRATAPPLLTPLMLRLQLWILALQIGLLAGRGRAMALSAMAVCLLAVAQLPPFEFVYDANNLNYRQQFGLALSSALAGLVLLPFRRRGIQALLMGALAATGIVTSAIGLSQAIGLYASFGLHAASGAGLWILVTSYIGMVAIALGDGLVWARSRI